MWQHHAKEHLKAVVEAIQANATKQKITIELMQLDNLLAGVNSFKQDTGDGKISFLNEQASNVKKKIKAITDAVEQGDKRDALLAANQAADLLV